MTTQRTVLMMTAYRIAMQDTTTCPIRTEREGRAMELQSLVNGLPQSLSETSCAAIAEALYLAYRLGATDATK